MNQARMDNVRTEETARRNDIARKLGLEMVLTVRAAELPDTEGLLRAVRSYNEFTPKNDPYEAHDMGFFNWGGKPVIWKIDYLDPTLTHFEDPISPTSKRIITIMLKSEY